MSAEKLSPQLTEVKLITHLFEEIAGQLTFKTAVVYNSESISYYELNRKSNRLAHFLRRQGVGRNSLVGIFLDQSIDKIVSLLAVLKAGAAYVPLDPAYPESRIKYMLENSAAACLISTRANRRVLNDGGRQILLDDQEVLVELNGMPDENPEVINQREDLVYVIYTSGSTGLPKGVKIAHRNLLNYITWFTQQSGITEGDITLQFASTSFDASIMDLWIPLVCGATLHLYADNRVLGEHLADFIDRYQITMLPFISSMALASLPVNEMTRSLKTICFGGEAFPDELIDLWLDRVKLIQAYGPTEATVAVSSIVCRKNVSGRVIGKPGANNILYILDDLLNPVPVGTSGELYIGGEQVAAGYLNNHAATAAQFINNPFASEAEKAHGWTTLYKTGDLVTLQIDGDLFFNGRKDDQVKIRGHRIELGEIEAVIGRMPNVRQGIVKVYKDAFANNFLMAYVIFDTDLTPEQAALGIQVVRTALNKILPAYMIPQKWKWLSEIPVTASGKIDRSILRPDEEGPELVMLDDIETDNYVAILTRIWSVYLQQEDFQSDDNFFDAGAHSLMLAQVYAALPENIRTWIKMPDFFAYPTAEKAGDIIKTRISTGKLSEKERERAVINELLQDAVLDKEFRVNEIVDLNILTICSAIFLTGATGFVGSQLLLDLLQSTSADIYCLVRSTDDSEGLARLQNTFSRFSLSWPSTEAHRIKVVTGDLTQPKFGVNGAVYAGLVEKIEVIYHSGSSVSYIEPYPVIKKANIDGLKNILSFAVANRVKPLILLSSMGVFSWGRPFTGKTWMHETDNIDANIRAVSKDLGYIRSKWVMEKIMQQAIEKGLPVINFRLGFAVCNGKTGATSMSQWWGALVRACVEIGAFPLVMGLKDELTTVDYMTKTIVHISRNPTAVGKNFHLSPLPENNISLTDFFARMNEYYHFNLKGLPYLEWLDLWKNNSSNPLFALLSLFTDDVHNGRSLVECYEQTYYYTRNNTADYLQGTDITPPVFDKQTMTPYLRFMGILPG